MTELTSFQRDFPKICAFAYNEPLRNHTSFKIGGDAEVMAFPANRQELSALLRAASDAGIRPAILGAGTNVLAPDAGMRGLVICLKDCLNGIEWTDDTHIRVMAGVTMTRAAVFAANHGLSGLEFAHGIPGSVGGGVYMNAGAYGGEIAQVADQVEVMDYQGNLLSLTGAEMEFSYRHSIVEEKDWIVISALFRLTSQEPQTIKATMKELMAKRSNSQPLDVPSAGSAFKRPVGEYAAALIDGAGLKGFQVGGAAVSTKHAGFVVNVGNATAADVRTLLQQVSDRVWEQTGIRLEPEIRIW